MLRRPVADQREASYQAEGVDCYLFNLDDDTVLDSTQAGGIARFTVREMPLTLVGWSRCKCSVAWLSLVVLLGGRQVPGDAGEGWKGRMG